MTSPPPPRRVSGLAAAAACSLSLVACGDPASPGDLDAGGDTGQDASDVGGACQSPWTASIDGSDRGAFMSVWGRSVDEVYVVGGQPLSVTADRNGVALRYDGTMWNDVPLAQGGMLNWVHGAGRRTWFVGEAGRVVTLDDGAVVSDRSAGTEAPLWGVWAASEDEAWAVGGDPLRADATPVIMRWDGTAWTLVEVPPLDRPARALFKVWAAGPDEVWAVGMLGVILRYDGTSWAQVPSGTGDDLVSLWGRAADDIVAVGGRSGGTLGRWDGSAWTFERLPRTSGLNGSWMGPDGVAHAVGVGGRALVIVSGFEFTSTTTPTSRVLHAMWALPGGPCFAVGGSLLSSPPYVGDIVISD